jgi:hypothetical protein
VNKVGLVSKLFRRKPSPSLVISIVALVLAASGSAMAASKLVSGDSLIKQNSLSGNRIKGHTLTATQINLNKLGKVPHAAIADTATDATNAVNATNATNAVTASSAAISKVTYVTTPGTVSGTTPLLLTATCPAGTTVIGGGGNATNEADAFVNDTYPAGKTGWSVDFYSEDESAVAVTVTAICAPAATTAP